MLPCPTFCSTVGCIRTIIFKRIIGVICVLVGLLALFTPLTPGSWLTLIGLELLGFGFLIPKRIRAMYHNLMVRWKLKKAAETADLAQKKSIIAGGQA